VTTDSRVWTPLTTTLYQPQQQQQEAVNKPSIDSETLRLFSPRPLAVSHNSAAVRLQTVDSRLNVPVLLPPRHCMPDTAGRDHVDPSMQQLCHTTAVVADLGPRLGSYQVPLPRLYAAGGIPRMGNRLPDCAVGLGGRSQQPRQQVPPVCGPMDAGISYQDMQWSAASPANCAVLQHNNSSPVTHWPLSQPTQQQHLVVNWPPSQPVWTSQQSQATRNEHVVVSPGNVNRSLAWTSQQSTDTVNERSVVSGNVNVWTSRQSPATLNERTVVSGNINAWTSRQSPATVNEHTAVSGNVDAWTSPQSPAMVNEHLVVSSSSVNRTPAWTTQQSPAAVNEHTVVSGGNVNRPPMWTSPAQFPAATVNGPAAGTPRNCAAAPNVDLSRIYASQQAACRTQIPNQFNISPIPGAARLHAVSIPAGGGVSVPAQMWVQSPPQQRQVAPACNAAQPQSSVQRTMLPVLSPVMSPVCGSPAMVFVGGQSSSAVASPPIIWRSRFAVAAASNAARLSAGHVTATVSAAAPADTSQTEDTISSSSSASVMCSPPAVVSDAGCLLRNNTVGRVYQLPAATTAAPVVPTPMEHAVSSQQSSSVTSAFLG